MAAEELILDVKTLSMENFQLQWNAFPLLANNYGYDCVADNNSANLAFMALKHQYTMLAPTLRGSFQKSLLHY